MRSDTGTTSTPDTRSGRSWTDWFSLGMDLKDAVLVTGSFGWSEDHGAFLRFLGIEELFGLFGGELDDLARLSRVRLFGFLLVFLIAFLAGL